MSEQLCDLKKVRGRHGMFKCHRPGCKHPALPMRVNPSTGQPWKLSEFVAPVCTVPTSLPSLHRMAWSFVKAWYLHLRHGRPATPAHLRAQRLAACRGCEKYIDSVCQLCGCGVKPKRRMWLTDKLSMGSQSCPLGKWGPVELAPRFSWLEYLSPYER
jgi:hypothetical protein